MRFAFLICHDDPQRIHIRDYPVLLRNDTNTRIFRDLIFDSRSNIWRMWRQQRYRLTLHVGTHQGTRSIIVFKERDTRRGHRDDLLWRDVRQFDIFAIRDDRIAIFTGDHAFIDQTSIPDLVGLGDDIIRLFIRRKIDRLFLNRAIFVYDPIWRLDKAILIDLGISRQVGDQLDRTNTAIVRRVNVTHLESGTFPRKSTRPQCRNTTLIGQLGQWVLLVHELRKLRRREELFDRRCQRSNVRQFSWR